MRMCAACIWASGFPCEGRKVFFLEKKEAKNFYLFRRGSPLARAATMSSRTATPGRTTPSSMRGLPATIVVGKTGSMNVWLAAWKRSSVYVAVSAFAAMVNCRRDLHGPAAKMISPPLRVIGVPTRTFSTHVSPSKSMGRTALQASLPHVAT